MFTIQKSTLSDHNRGICGSRNNCYYKGSTVCWVLLCDGEDFGAVTRKKDAELVAELMNENLPEWDKRGDHFRMVMKFATEQQQSQLWDMKEV